MGIPLLWLRAYADIKEIRWLINFSTTSQNVLTVCVCLLVAGRPPVSHYIHACGYSGQFQAQGVNSCTGKHQKHWTWVFVHIVVVLAYNLPKRSINWFPYSMINSRQPQILAHTEMFASMTCKCALWPFFLLERQIFFFFFFFQVAATSFAIYVFTGNVLTASKASVALSLFNVMRFPLVMLPDVIVSCIQVGTC